MYRNVKIVLYFLTKPFQMRQVLLIFLLTTTLSVSGQEVKRALTIDDILAIKTVREVEVSPDEKWIAYTVSTIDTSEDKSNARIWMVSTNGGTPIPMTAEEYSAGKPRWSPDGQYLSFLASKGEKAKTQVWNLNRLGGEAQQVTKSKQGISDYEWSPDGKRLLLLMKDPKPAELTEDTKDDGKPLPHVIDRIHFKEDYEGYLDSRRDHLYVFTPGDSVAIQITSGDYDDSDPKWSPDGKTIAFVSNRSDNPDLSYNSDIWMVSADNTDKGASLKQITSNPGFDVSPNWSPDGNSLIYVTSTNVESMPFSMSYIAIININNGTPKILAENLDRQVFDPSFSKDGTSIYFGLEDQGEQYLASMDLLGNNFTKIINQPINLLDYALTKDTIYTLHSNAYQAAEIYKFRNNQLVQLTQVNNELLSNISLGSHTKVHFKSKDGTDVEGFVIKPNNFDASIKYPLILWIHGGPIAQYTYNLHPFGQFFAARGYVVLLVNPRGSTGYGEAFCKAIFADWGNKDYDDVVAGVDYLIEQGYVSEDRLGVGGWSYGGILTNYVITKTSRFKAAISGASLGIIRANFGHDQYVKWYNSEFTMPWENKELWERLSPFNNVENITTPTLWMGGAIDWNVPIMNSEQMYLAMKSLGRETQLVVYPGEHHGIRRPSFQKDRLQRWVDWYDKYLK